jgi:hypothetical protein
MVRAFFIQVHDAEYLFVLKGHGHFYPWGHRKRSSFGMKQTPVNRISQFNAAPYNDFIND